MLFSAPSGSHKRDSFKITLGAGLIFFNLIRQNYGFLPFDISQGFDYALVMNGFTALMYGLGLWLVNSGFRVK
jgi:hypothetical protein